ncbi:hypothetical protein QCA50_004824 [Cerrena zonata]|uniref:Uncharacterized protein n=1 Tax=Cerrena zonata TaxID=2478898 RepID=A0AAW0GDM3_9APHY
MYSAFDIAGLILGIAGLSGTVMLIRYLLPKHRIASSERVYASAYTLYQCSVSEGLLLPEEKTKLRERLRRVRTDLNNLKNDVTCLNGTCYQKIIGLSEIYRGLGAIDHTLQSICTQLASTSREGRERLAKDGIPYEPCMFPLAATVSHYLESFKASDASDVAQLFPSQDDLSSCSSSDITVDTESTPHAETNEPQPSVCSHPTRAPQHRDSFSSTTATVVEEKSLYDLDPDATGISSDTKPVNDEPDLSLLLRLLPTSFQKGVDPSIALSSYCTDL